MLPSQDTAAQWRFWFLRLLIIAVAGLLVARLYHVQIVEGADYRLLADRNRLRTLEVPAPRGVIYDRNGELLASNAPSFSVVVIPDDLPHTPEGVPDERADAVVLDRLMALLAQPQHTPAPHPAPAAGQAEPLAAGKAITSTASRAALDQQIQAGEVGGAYKSIAVAQNISEDAAFSIAEAGSDLPGVEVVPQPVRDYPAGPLTAHLLGYMGSIPEGQAAAYAARGYDPNEEIGVAGLEGTLQEQLRGQPGHQTVEVDVNGRRVRTVGSPTPAEPGLNAVLTIDAGLQRAATQALQAALDQSKGFTKATQGAVVALDPRSGAVLALVSLPAYDDNWFSHGITPEAWQLLTADPDRPLLDLAIGGAYPPGSTFKLITAAAGLQEGVISDKTLLGDGFDGANDGVIYLANKYGGPATPFYDWSHAYGYGLGLLTVRQAIAESSDVFFYELGGGYQNITPGLGLTALGYYAKQFGLGAPTGIDLPGEAQGLVPDERYKRLNYAELWTTGDTYNMSIGQGFDLATPLQIANMTAAVANHGSLYRPQLVDHFIDAAGRIVRDYTPDLIRKVPVDPAYLDLVREGMYGAVNWPSGTAPSARLPGIAVAGKTGTAQYFRADAQGKPVVDEHGALPNHAWFTSFAPYADPEIVVTVFIANGGEGSAVAAPVAGQILKAYFALDGQVAGPQATPPATGSGH